MKSFNRGASRIKRAGNVAIKILAGVAIGAVGLLLLMLAYKIIEFLVVAAILLVGFGVVPVFWWR